MTCLAPCPGSPLMPPAEAIWPHLRVLPQAKGVGWLVVVNQREFEEPPLRVRPCYWGFFGLDLRGSDTAQCWNLVLVINRRTILFLWLESPVCPSIPGRLGCPVLVPGLPSHRPSSSCEPLPGGGEPCLLLCTHHLLAFPQDTGIHVTFLPVTPG